MLAKPQGFPRKLGGCAGLDPRLRSAVSAGVGDGERGLRRGLRAPGVGVRPKWVLEYSPSNKRIRYFVSITYVRTGLWTAHKFCGGGENLLCAGLRIHNSMRLSRIFRNQNNVIDHVLAAVQESVDHVPGREEFEQKFPAIYNTYEKRVFLGPDPCPCGVRVVVDMLFTALDLN